MYIVGITGPTGAGKTLAMQALEKLGALVLDCDGIYHELLLTNKEMVAEIGARFPEASQGSVANTGIDRKILAKTVFNDPIALADLSEITHKHVWCEVERRISEHGKQGGTMAVVNAIALIEARYTDRCNAVLCVTAPQEERMSRIMARDGLSRTEALSRIKAQKSDSFYIENSDYVLDNTYDNTDEFEEACMNTVLIDKWFEDHKNEMIGDLGRLVAINSVRTESKPGAPFGTAPREALQLGQEMLEAHGLEVSVFEDMVITADFGPQPPQLGILTHLDIVEAGEHWDTDPFVLSEKDGKLFGRGVMDNKGPAVATMYALYCVRELFPELKTGVRLIFGSSEETGFDDIAQYMQACSASTADAMPPNVFSPDADFPVVNIEKGRFMPVFGAKWEKDTSLPRIVSITGGKTPNIVPNFAEAVIEGFDKKEVEAYCKEFSEKTGVEISVSETKGDTVTITAKGTASHASRPQLGNNAQTALVEMLAAMPFAESDGFKKVCVLARLFPHGDYYGNALGLAAKDEISGETTVNFGVLRYDELEFSACFDARTAICADEIDILGKTREVLAGEGISISYHELKRSHHTPEDSPFVQTLLRVYERYTGKPGECIHMGGLTYVHDIPGGVAYGCGMPEDDNNVHGANEYIDTEQLVMCSKMFANTIVEVCGAVR